MKKTYLQLKRKLAMLVALLCLMPIMPVMATEVVVNVTGKKATIVQSSTLYLGEVVLDGQQSFYYLYSDDLTNSETVFAAVKDCLSDFKGGMFKALVPDMIGASEVKGIAVCSNANFSTMMNSNWTSAANAGLACLSDVSVISSSSVDLFETDADFAAKCSEGIDEEGVEYVDNVGNQWTFSGILGKLSTTITDNVTGYTTEDNVLVKHIDRQIDYTCEAVTVIYTKVELGITAQPLTFEAVEEGTITIENPNGLTIEYNQNNNGWTSSSANPISISVAANDVVLFRGDNACYWSSSDSGEEVTRFTATNPVYVYGNVMSLIEKDDFATVTTLTEEFALAYLFAAPSSSMYEFYATNSTIRNHPTKDLVLPATTLTGTCYGYMFAGCEGLTRAPQLPATTLAEGCYHQMFADCTGLTTAPELNAPTLADMCYSSMFYNCSSLNYVKCLATDFSALEPTFGWLEGVAATGTFVKAAIVDLPRNENGIPAGWTVEVADGVGTSATLTANADGKGNYWTTYYNGMASVSADDNTTVFTAKVSDDKSQVTLTAVTDGVIPVGNAVVMMSSAATVTLTVNDATGTLSDNDLLGQSESFTTPADLFALSKGTSGVGFYRYPMKSGLYSTQFPAQKAYLIISGGGSARTFVPFGDCAPTAVQSVPSTADDADAPLYDLTGRKVATQPHSGIYVKNGKLVIIK